MNLLQIVAALCWRHAQVIQIPEPEPPATWRGRLARSLCILGALTLPADAQLDTSGTGMSDVWERQFNNGNLFDSENPDHQPEADPDGDGWTNFQESIAGTDPFSGSPPEGMVATYVTHLSGEGETADSVIISWDTLQGKQYILKTSPDLTAASWIPVSDPIIGEGHPVALSVTLTDTGGEAPEKLFWRVRIADIDSDGDGLTDYEEYILGSNPFTGDTTGTGIPDLWIAMHLGHIQDIFSNFDPHAESPGGGSTMIENFLSGSNPLEAYLAGLPSWVITSTGESDDDIPSEKKNKERIIGIPPKTMAMVAIFVSSEEFKAFTGSPSQFNDELSWRIVVGPDIDNNIIEGDVNVNDLHDDWLIAESADFRIPGMHNYAHLVHWQPIMTLSEPVALKVTATAENVGDDRFPSDIAIGILPFEVKNVEPASGVDHVSFTAFSDAIGKQHEIWLMAPLHAEVPTATKSRLASIPGIEGIIECDDTTITPSLLSLDGEFQQMDWDGDGGNGIAQTATATIRFGAMPDLHELPLKVKIMKRRTVKVRVIQAGRALPGGVVAPSPAMMPTTEEMQAHLNRIFGRQINAWFEIEHNPTLIHAVDWGEEFRHGSADEHSDDQTLVINQSGGIDVSHDIHVYLIANDSPFLNLDGTSPAAGVAIINEKTCWVLSKEVETHTTKQQLLDTLAHEVGHILLGEGHPGDPPSGPRGPAPLDGVDMGNRLMYSRNGPESLLLVKAEWDQAEEWLITNIDPPNNE